MVAELDVFEHRWFPRLLRERLPPDTSNPHTSASSTFLGELMFSRSLCCAYELSDIGNQSFILYFLFFSLLGDSIATLRIVVAGDAISGALVVTGIRPLVASLVALREVSTRNNLIRPHVNAATSLCL